MAEQPFDPTGIAIVHDAPPPLAPATAEQLARYRAAYEAYVLACDAVVAARVEWLPDTMPVGAQQREAWGANQLQQQAIIDDVWAKRAAARG